MSEDPPRRLGKYIILEEIGRGGFGVVYRAEDTSLGDRVVALKVLHPQLVVDPTSVRLFTQEAGTAARLEHRHIVTIYEADTHQGMRYIAMKYLPGPSLAQVLTREGPQPVDRVIAWLQQVASALDHAHGQGIVHRDLKPGNILLDAEGQVVVTDFGLARAAEVSGGISTTRDGAIMTGTARYMAPEQARRGKATPRSDVYSLGIVAYELLTGRVPFEEGDAFSIALQHISESPPPLRQFRADLPEQVEQVVLKALEKEPGERYASTGQFAGALGVAAHRAEAQRQRQEELAALYTRLLALEEADNWAGAIELAERLERDQPGYRDVSRRLQRAKGRFREQQAAQRRQRLADQYDALRAAEAREDWAAVIQLATQLEEQERGYRDVAERRSLAQARQQEELEAASQRQLKADREQRLAILYDTLLEQEAGGDWAGVLGLARQILAEASAYRDVEERQANAVAQRKKQQARREREQKRRDEEGRARRARWRRPVLVSGAAVVALVALYLLLRGTGRQPTARPDGLVTAQTLVTPASSPSAGLAPAVTSQSPTPSPTVGPTTTPGATDTPLPERTDNLALLTAEPEGEERVDWGPLLLLYVDYGCSRGWAKGTEGLAQVDLTGPDGGTWYVAFSDDTCTAVDSPASPPDALLRVSTDDLAHILQGDETVSDMIDDGRLVIEGEDEDVVEALRRIVDSFAVPEPAPTVILVTVAVTRQVTATPGTGTASTPKPPATNTRRPSATQTPRSPTPTPRAPQFPAPALLAPASGAVFGERDPIVLTWQPVGPLPADGYYVVTVAYAHGDETWFDEIPWTKSTNWTLSEHRYLLDPGQSNDGRFRWSVQVMRRTGYDRTGRWTGTPLGPRSEERTLIWKANG